MKRFNKFLIEEKDPKKMNKDDKNSSSLLKTSETSEKISSATNIDDNSKVNQGKKKFVKNFDEILSNLDENDFQDPNDSLLNEILISDKDPVLILDELNKNIKTSFKINIRTEFIANVQKFYSSK